MQGGGQLPARRHHAHHADRALHTRPHCAPDDPAGYLKRSEQLPLVLTPARQGVSW
jgi:hypothetical protein